MRTKHVIKIALKSIIITSVSIALLSCSKENLREPNIEIIIVTQLYAPSDVSLVNEYLKEINSGFTLKIIPINNTFIDSEGNAYNPTSAQYQGAVKELDSGYDMVQSGFVSPYEVDYSQTVSELELLDLTDIINKTELFASFPRELFDSMKINGTYYFLPGFTGFFAYENNYAYMINEALANQAGIDVSSWNEDFFNYEAAIIEILDYHKNNNVVAFYNENSLASTFPHLTPLINGTLISSPLVVNESTGEIELFAANENLIESQQFFKNMLDKGYYDSEDVTAVVNHTATPLLVFNPLSLSVREIFDVMNAPYVGVGSFVNHLNRGSLWGLGVNKNSDKLAEIETLIELLYSDKTFCDLLIYGRAISANDISEYDYFLGYGNDYLSLGLISEAKKFYETTPKSLMYGKDLDLSSDSMQTLEELHKMYLPYSASGRIFWDIDYHEFLAESTVLDLEELLNEINATMD